MTGRPNLTLLRFWAGSIYTPMTKNRLEQTMTKTELTMEYLQRSARLVDKLSEAVKANEAQILDLKQSLRESEEFLTNLIKELR